MLVFAWGGIGGISRGLYTQVACCILPRSMAQRNIFPPYWRTQRVLGVEYTPQVLQVIYRFVGNSMKTGIVDQASAK